MRLPPVLSLLCTGLLPLAALEVTELSQAPGGSPANGASYGSAITPDGRYVAFTSAASNLVPGDTNNQNDVFRLDTLTGAIIRASVRADGSQANGSANYADISADGRFVVFSSNSTNMVAGEANLSEDIFRKDLVTGEVLRVSQASDALQANNASLFSAISADGRYVAFVTYASNLVAAPEKTPTIFHKDLNTGTLTPIHRGAGNRLVGGQVAWESPAISADGRLVFFYTNSDNMVAGPNHTIADIYVRDVNLDTPVRVSASAAGELTNAPSNQPAVTPDGRYVVFRSQASNLVAGDTNGVTDIFRKDLVTGEVTLVSKSSTGTQANIHHQYVPAISADGRYVAFQSAATNLVANDTNGSWDIFRKDLVTGSLVRVNQTALNAQVGGDANRPRLTANGQSVVFDHYGFGLTASDTDSLLDVFRVKFLLPQTITGFAPTRLGLVGQSLDLSSVAGGSSGNPVVFFCSNPAIATIDGQRIDCLAPGQVTIKATQAGNDAYAPAQTAYQELTIQAPLTINAESTISVYGEEPVFSVSYSGFLNGDGPTALSGTLTFISDASSTADVGTYEIRPLGLTSTTYAISFAAGTHTIVPAPLVITALPQTRVYGAPFIAPADPPPSDSLLSVSGATSIPPGVLASVVVNGPVSALPVGTHTNAISASGPATLDNYALSYVSGALTVVPAALTISANNLTKIAGASNPPLTASYSGLVAGETSAVLTTTPRLRTTATTASPAGTYPITIDLATAANYQITFVPGTLTVVPLSPDQIDQAQPVAGSSGTSALPSRFATTRPTEPLLADAGRTLWWRWVPPFAGTAVLDTQLANVDTTLQVFAVDPGWTPTSPDDFTGLGTAIAANDNVSTTSTRSRLVIDVVPTQAYYVTVGDRSTSGGTSTLRWSLASENNAFARARALVGASGIEIASATNANRESGEPVFGGLALGRSLWWTITPDTDGLLSLSTEGSQAAAGAELDTLLGVFTGTAVSRLSLRALTDDTPPDLRHGETAVKVRAGVTYAILVDQSGATASDGTYRLTWSLTPTAGPQ